MTDPILETVIDVGTEACPICSNPISLGEVVIRRQDQVTIHEDCPATEEVPDHDN